MDNFGWRAEGNTNQSSRQAKVRKTQLMLSAGQQPMGKPRPGTHRHEAKFGQPRAEMASWQARVQQ